jgi:urease gamma subunit
MTDGEMIDQIMEWINTDGEQLSDEDVMNNIREMLKQ